MIKIWDSSKGNWRPVRKDKDYWIGVLHTCEEFQSLGVEDAMQTDMAQWAKHHLEIPEDEQV